MYQTFARLGFFWILLALVPPVASAHQIPKPPPPKATDIPGMQLLYITRVPPSEWGIEGLVAATDLGRLLLRHKSAGHNPEKRNAFGGGRDYDLGHFENLEAPDLFKVDLGKEGLKILEAPQEIIVMPHYRYQLPLIVKNGQAQAEMLTVRTPWKIYELNLPGDSVRGFCLSLRRTRPGKATVPVSFEVGHAIKSTDLTIDVRPTGRLKVRLLDDSYASAAARVYLTGADGLAHMPRGAIQRMTWSTAEYFFYAKDGFEVVLPEGEAMVEAARGLEYAPVKEIVRIEGGKTVSVDLRLDHRFPLNQEKWYSGDSHIHTNYFTNEVVEAEDIHLQVSGEGLDIANLMVANSSSEIVHDERFFEGKPHRLSKGHRILYWNEEMRNRRLYGHMSFFNLKTLVHPLYTGFPGTKHWEDYPPNYYQAKGAKEQGGAVTYVHPAIGTSFKKAGYGGALEFPVDLALGQVDAFDVLSNTDEIPAMELWYRMLNCGFHCAISAGTDSFTNLMMAWVPGGSRVYVHVPGDFSYQQWIQNYKKGMSFVTNGPMLKVSVNGAAPGDKLRFSNSAQSSLLRIKAEAESIVPMDTLEIIVNGSVVASKQVGEGQHEAIIEKEIELERSSWVAARVLGPAHRLVLNDIQAFAHSGAVYCLLEDAPITSSRDASFWMTWIDDLIEAVMERGTFATTERRDSVIDLFRKAQDVYRGKLAADN